MQGEGEGAGKGTGEGPRSRLAEGYVLDQGREALGTTALEAAPYVILKMPEDSYAPFWLGLSAALFFAGLALRAWYFAGLALVLAAATIVVWLWPERRLMQREPDPVARN